MPAAPLFARLHEGSWDELFDFIDPDRAARPGHDEVTHARYLEITRRLVCFFAGRRCRDAEDLAAETVLRVAARCHAVDVSGYSDRLGYFLAVARNVHHEWIRHELRDSSLRASLKLEMRRLPPIDTQSKRGQEAVHQRLDRCLQRLTERARRLIVRYYGDSDATRIADHHRLAGEFGKSPNALRIEVHRIRRTLRDCVFGGLES